MRQTANLLIFNTRQVLTCAYGEPEPKRGAAMNDIGLILGGAVACHNGNIVAVGPENIVKQQIELSSDAVIVDAEGGVVMPGLVDCHTHSIYAGSRAEEFALKLAGASYLDILKQGGGINTTVRHSRQAPDTELKAQTAARLNNMLDYGTTTVEIKSGYGLATAEELRHLRIIGELGAEMPLDIVPTFMGAHAIPPEYIGRGEQYVELVLNEMLPAIARQGIARYCDVFCEAGVFSAAQAEQILLTAKTLGLATKIHAEELGETGGAVLAGKIRSSTAEHLLYVTDRGIRALTESGTIAVLLPGTSFYLREKYAPARDLITAGVPIAVASDANPGSCPCENLQLVLNIACLYLRLTPEEAINAVTLNAAHALGMADKVGSLEYGKQADLLVLSTDDYRFLAYHYGTNLVRRMIKKGKLITHGQKD